MTLTDQRLRAGLTDIFAGAVCSVLSIAYCLSYAVLIFSGPLESLLSKGIAVTFLSATVAGTIVALRSSLPFAVAGPDSSTSVVFAALVTTLVQRLVAGGNTDLLAPTLIAMSLTTGVTGILLFVLGVARAGRAIRFVPYPVIGGFLGATGWLMITGAIQVVTNQHVGLSTLGGFVNAGIGEKLLPAALVAIALTILRRYKSPFVLPGVLLSAFVAAHLFLLSTGTSVAAAQDGGWMFHLQSAAGLSLPWTSSALSRFPWSALPSISADALAVMFVTITTFLLNTTGIEIATRTEADVEGDLKVLGIANIASAALGGYVSCTSLSRSILVRNGGATGRLTGLTVAGITAILLFTDPSFLGYVPKFLLGGLLFYLGADLVLQWLVQSSRRLLPLEYLSLLAIAILIVYSGFVAGVLIGVVIGCATFAFSASRVSAIKFTFDGLEYRSALDRGPYELSLLAENGRQIQGVALQSYLFFGSATRLYEHVKSRLATEPDCRFLIFDFRLVTGIDSSATHSFAQIKEAAGSCSARLVLVNLSPDLERAFRTARFITGDVILATNLDRALESCEQRIIEIHRTEDDGERSFRTWLADSLGQPQFAERLTQICRRLDISAGGVVAKQGDPADSMHFILEGRIGIVVELGEGRSMRVRSLGRHTTIGEMGLITGRPRSATIAAETDSVLYELSAEAYERIKREEPALSTALLGYVIAVMAERLTFANRALGVLQR
ncbi:MAG TPA: SulP family inorganic anion transporter [Xanthobacteraceae bacterium]|nr:SulP family inorganic anion transporter [Xanthobacteraceae bacterium]